VANDASTEVASAAPYADALEIYERREVLALDEVVQMRWRERAAVGLNLRAYATAAANDV
jgi:hypothetical protein